MEQVNKNEARAVGRKDWCIRSDRTRPELQKMQGATTSMMSARRYANLSPNPQHSIDFADIKDRIRSGLSKCMSHPTAHLKDEVRFLETFVQVYNINDLQGTRAQVVIAGGIAGLVAR